MTEKGLAAVTTSLMLATGIGGCSPAPADRPALVSRALSGSNVLLVTIDTLRRDRVGAYGNPRGLTPLSTVSPPPACAIAHAFSHAPMTLPAHASILTGRIPIRHGIRNNGSYRLGEDVPTLATVLRGAGYRTGAFVGAFVLDARYGLSHGFDHYDDRYPPSGETRFDFAERRAADVVQAAGDWILTPPAGPWFAWVHLFDPHAPYDAPAEYRSGRAPYDAEVAYTDAMVGRLLERLRAGHALDHTRSSSPPIMASRSASTARPRTGCSRMDATLAVPLILSGPGIGVV